jgi:cytidylate kinase
MSYLYKRVATSIFQQQRRNFLTPTTIIHTRKATTTAIMSSITLELLTKQNAETSNALIENLSSSEAFQFLSNKEQELTMNRDNEDAIKLEKGIEFAKSKNVLDPNYVPQPYVQIDVLGKTPVMVVGEILNKIKEGSAKEDNSKQGSVIALCGLSGTGKGTTVSTLRKKLEDDEGHQVVTWSNGNIFRSVTLLAVTWCEQQSDIDGFDEEKSLTKENLESFMGMLSFGKFKGKYDTRINGLGLDLYVSEVQNTVLKESKVAKSIPTVAEKTQGEVVSFAADAVDIMGKGGIFVLLEGREQTVDFVRTPFRFTLILSDESLIGKRRAAQRVMATTLEKVSTSATDAEVEKTLQDCLVELATGEGYKS